MAEATDAQVPTPQREDAETVKARVGGLWSAWEEVQKEPELVSLFDRKGELDSDKDPKQILEEHGYPERTRIQDLQFEDWTANIDPKFVKDGFVYLLRGDYPGLDKKGFYSRTFGYGKLTTGQLADKLKSPKEVGYLLMEDERYLNLEPQSSSIAQQLAYQQSAVGGSSFISATTNLDSAIAGTGNQPDKEEQKGYQVYVLKVPQEYVINSNTGNHFGMNENEYLVPDYIAPDEIVATFPRDGREEIYRYMHEQLGISMEDLGIDLEKEATPIAEIKAIGESRGQMIKTRDEIIKLVEPPLVPACEHFWDLNIRTLESSANANDVGSYAGIAIDYDSLSDENKRIARESADLLEDYDGKPAINFKIPVTNETTLEEIKQRASAFAEGFKKQKASWIPSYSLGQMREIYDSDPDDNEFGPEAFVKEGWYYDIKNQKFYLSEEHFKKVNEELE